MSELIEFVILSKTGTVITMQYPKRKLIRLKDYDYSTEGAYFVTICAKERQDMILSNIVVGRDDLGTPSCNIQLTPTGNIVKKYIDSIMENYKNVSVDKYIIMPDHIHMLIKICGVPRSSRPTDISTVIGALKRLANKEIGHNIFQTSFYDHVIRDETDYITKWNYIENNPVKWVEQKKVTTNDKL